MVPNPRSTEFWSREALDKEVERAFDICHGCRLCFNLCPSFATLFGRIDERDGEVTGGHGGPPLQRRELDEVVDLCYQCKLCDVKCPYTPPHEFELDFPRLMMRAKALRVRDQGQPFRDRILGRTDLLGRLNSLLAPMANWANRNRLNRRLMGRVLGIHPARALPRYHRNTFERWFSREGRRRMPESGSNGRVALFYTCSVNYNRPEVGRAAVGVLAHNEVSVTCPPQVCCGMPYLDGGDIGQAVENARTNVRALAQAVDEGCDIVVPGPSCSYMLKKEYPYLLGTEEAARVSEKTQDLCEYLMRLHGQGRVRTDFVEGAGKVAYHLPCHLKAQNIGFKSRDLLKLLPDTTVELVDRCSGMDGTWGMKTEFFDLSLKVARKLFSALERSEPDLAVSDCPLAQLQIEHGTGKQAVHPIEVVARAYGLDA